ncbi:hypothetical protein ID866_13358 [Astraeus odoratus]|nr:hypothetical protein ID866_13358 [Astraeus odoratus]
MSQMASPEDIVNTFIDSIRPDFNYVIALTTFTASMVTVPVLFTFSTKESRRRLEFRLNVFSIFFCPALDILKVMWRCEYPHRTFLYLMHASCDLSSSLLLGKCSCILYVHIVYWRHHHE